MYVSGPNFKACHVPVWNDPHVVVDFRHFVTTGVNNPNCFLIFDYNFLKQAETSLTHGSSKVRTNSGKQTITYTAAVFWDNIPIHLKQLNVFNFSKQLKHNLLSEQLCENL